MKTKKIAIKSRLIPTDLEQYKPYRLDDLLLRFCSCIDFAALAAQVDGADPRPVSPQGGYPPYPTEVMVRILVLKRLYNFSDEQMEYQILDCHSYQRFCGLLDAARLPDRTTIWHFENHIGVTGAEALFAAVEQQVLQHGYLARGGPDQRKETMPADWIPAKRIQKNLDASWIYKHIFPKIDPIRALVCP